MAKPSRKSQMRPLSEARDPLTWVVVWGVLSICELRVVCFMALCIALASRKTWQFLCEHRWQAFWTIPPPWVLALLFNAFKSRIPELTRDDVIVEIIVAVSGLTVWLLLGLFIFIARLLRAPSELYYKKVDELEELQAQLASTPNEPPKLVIDIMEAKFTRIFDAESHVPRTALYWEALITITPNIAMQVGDIELSLLNGVRVKVEEIPVALLERPESHWLRFPIPDTVNGMVQGCISVVANGQLWHSDQFEFEVGGLHLNRIVRP